MKENSGDISHPFLSYPDKETAANALEITAQTYVDFNIHDHIIEIEQYEVLRSPTFPNEGVHRDRRNYLNKSACVPVRKRLTVPQKTVFISLSYSGLLSTENNNNQYLIHAKYPSP